MEYMVLFNRRYPYETGESFLEQEMRYALKAFDKILVAPDEVPSGTAPTRKLESSRMLAVPIAKDSLRKARRKAVMKGLPGMFRYVRRHPQDRKAVGWSVGRRAYGCYFDAMAERDYRVVYRALKNQGVKKTDTVCIYSYWMFINARAAVLLARCLRREGYRVCLITRAHRFDLYESRSRLGYLPQRRELLQEMDQVYTVSEHGASYLRGKYPEYGEKIRVSRLGTADWGTGEAPEEGSIFHIVSCSRLTKVKRVDLLIQALEILEKRYRICWTHLGDGPEGAVLQKEAEKRLSRTQVEWKGMLSNQEIYQYYWKHPVHYLVNVSASEGLPVSIMEAVSFGIPVIATDVGGTGEIVVNGISGRLVEADTTPMKLAREMGRMFQMPSADYRVLRESARHLWKQAFQAEVNYREFYQKLGELAGTSDGTA